MAEESLYASDHKRKYEDSQPPTSRRSSGFSAPISLQSPTDAASAGQQPVSYNNVPPPLDEIQLAKQKAQEIAARLLSSADPSKKPRVENGGGGAAGYDANEGLFQKPFIPSVAPSASSYGYSSGGSKKIEIPSGRVGVIIGKGGETIKYLQLQSGARIQVTRDMDADPNSPTRSVELMGTPEQISKAEQLIQDVLAEADTGGSGNVSRRPGGEQAGSEHFVMKVPNNKVGLVIGKGGETIKNMQARTGARIQVIPLHLPPGDISGERTVQIDGTSEQIEAAKQLVNEVIVENRMRNQAMGGSYPQQGYQARPPTNWAPPGAPMQQPGYGYVQPGAYTGSAPSYNTSQPPYPGYPPQPGYGYATGWDQTTAPSSQQSVQGGGYDYYGQQQPPQQQQATGGPGAPADNSAYASNQPPTSGYNQGQVYPQDVYVGYNAPGSQSGYGQPPPNPVSGYDQQQSYNSTPGYGNASNQQPDSHAPYGTQGDGSQALPGHSSSTGQQTYPTGQQPSPKPSYPPQGSTQPGYGVPPYSQGGYGTQPAAGYGQGYAPLQAQKPPSSQPAYGQPQQSPSSQGSYDQSSASHPGYPPVQSSYAQPESVPQQPTSSGYGPTSAQLGYGAPTYGGPPGAQPNYGQPQAPVYSATYAGGYPQSQVYPSDDSASGSARGTSDSTLTQVAAVQPGGTTKTPPES